jgi:hypothetical protein
MSRWAVSLVFIMAIVAALSTAPVQVHALTIDTGHQGGITALALDSKRLVLASASTDGAVRVWDLKTRRQEAVLQVSRSAVQRLAISPTSSLLAAVENPTPRTARITVWDWSRAQRLYSIDLPDVPLHLDFSTLGTYLVYTRPEWRSIAIVDARSGRASPFLKDGFGIVSYVAFSRTERNLMAYQPSGRISYWEVRTGDKLKEVATASDLSPRRISDDLSTMVARSQNGFAIVDVATGALLAEQKQADVMALDSNPDGTRVFALSGSTAGRTAFGQWSYWQGSLTRVDMSSVAFDLARIAGSAAVLATAEDATYVGDEKGAIVEVPRYGSPAYLTQSNLADLQGLAASGDRAALAAAGVVRLFDIATATRLLGGRTTIREYREDQLAIPGSRDLGVAFLDDVTLAVWDRAGRGVQVCDLSPVAQAPAFAGARTVPAELFGSTLVSVGSAGPGAILTLEADGAIQIIDRRTFARLARFVAPGTRAVAWLSESVVVGARARLSRLEHPLIRVDLRTGETVPLPDSALLSTSLAADPRQGRLYSLALEESGGANATSVRVHDGQGFERIETIMRFAGEDPGASVIVEGGRVLSTIGFDGVQEWEDGRVSRLEATSHVPRQLAATRRLVFAVNNDRTASIWELRSGKLIADVYMFADASWLVSLPQENRVYSHGADRYILQK